MDKHRLGGMAFAGVVIAAVLAHQTIAGQFGKPVNQLLLESENRSVHIKDAAESEGAAENVKTAFADTNTASSGNKIEPSEDGQVLFRVLPNFAPASQPAVSMADVAVERALLNKRRFKFDFQALLQPEGYVRMQWQDLSRGINLAAEKTAEDSFIVMIDPGHGGIDPGTKGHNGLLEKDLTLDIARRIRLFLSEFDHIDVQLTRNHDYGLSRQERVDAIKQTAADLVISLHFNHLPQSKINLVETFYAGPQNIRSSQNARQDAHHDLSQPQLTRTARAAAADLNFTEGSARLAKTLQQHVYSEVNFGDDDAKNGGVKQETLFVLTRSFTPGVLMEISCLSHAAEADRLMSDDYRNRLAAALVDGIRSYHDSLQREPLKKRADIEL